MQVSADCQNTQSLSGRNGTPLAPIRAAHKVLGSIELDPASDAVINAQVGAERIYTIADDGLKSHWNGVTCWLNPPGRSVTGGAVEQRLDWAKNHRNDGYEKPKELTMTTTAQWFRKLYHHWRIGDIEHAIALVYRAGSIGSLGVDMLAETLCITAAGAEHSCINGSGRMSFELIAGDARLPQTSNTQASIFVLLSHCPKVQQRFAEEFSQFGVVKLKSKVQLTPAFAA
jgi:hypothetical protein